MSALAGVLAFGLVVALLAPVARRARLDRRPPRAPRRERPVALRSGRSAEPARPRAGLLVLTPLVAGAAVVAAVLAGFPAWAVPVAAIGALALRSRMRVRDRRRHARMVDRATPDLVDLLAVAAAAGHPVHRCLDVVAERAPPPVRPPIRSACRRLDGGAPLAVALDDLRCGLGTMGDPVADALLDAFRTGAPLQASLSRVAAVARDRRRRDAEVEARRLPVLLLFPLVCCVLPAFGLLAVVPLVVASLRSLG